MAVCVRRKCNVNPTLPTPTEAAQDVAIEGKYPFSVYEAFETWRKCRGNVRKQALQVGQMHNEMAKGLLHPGKKTTDERHEDNTEYAKAAIKS